MAAAVETGSNVELSGPSTVGLFGTYYPEFQKAGNSTTGFSLLWASLPGVERVVVVAPRGSTLPPGVPPGRIEIHPTWELDRLTGLARAALHILRHGRGWDVLVWNIHLTSFGRRPWVNAFGLSLPSFLSKTTGRRPVVFLHHLLESQDVASLGYRPSGFTRRVVHLLESALVRSCRVVVPLESQRVAVRAHFGTEVAVRFPVHVEGVASGLVAPPGAPARGPTSPRSGPHVRRRVLLFGYWGPQNELEGVLEDLARADGDRGRFEVTVAGEVNVNFPEYEARLRELGTRLPRAMFRFIGPVPEEQLAALFAHHDVLVLPYRATGGYSGTMNLAAPSGIGLVAYDLPQLRETAEAIGARVWFVAPRDPRALGEAIEAAAGLARAPGRHAVDPTAWERARRAAAEILTA
ncbi:MAG TPA: glycosyltransferase [Thermoplasmata archaeon]